MSFSTHSELFYHYWLYKVKNFFVNITFCGISEVGFSRLFCFSGGHMDFRVTVIIVLEAALALFLVFRSGSAETLRGLISFSLLIFLAFFIRYSLLDYETTDYQWFLTKWVDFYRMNGGFAALNRSIGNYNIPYLYFLSLFSYSTIKDLYLIKLLSIFFDVILAFACMKLAENAGASANRSAAAFFTVLFLPTVIINGAMWAQCDSIYASLAILGIAVSLGESFSRRQQLARRILSMMCISVSFGFKLQAVFIMPVYIIIWIWKKYKWYDFAVFPLTYLILILPAVILGRPIMDAIMLYADQAGTVGSALNYNSPSITALIRNPENPEGFATVCILLAFLVMSAIIVLGILFRKRLTHQSMLALIVLMVLAIPFSLPHMHDRYFFLADILTITFACLVSRKFSIYDRILRIAAALLMQFGSLICYLAYLKTHYIRVGSIYLTNDRGAVAVILCIIIAIYTFCTNLKAGEKKAQISA